MAAIGRKRLIRWLAVLAALCLGASLVLAFFAWPLRTVVLRQTSPLRLRLCPRASRSQRAPDPRNHRARIAGSPRFLRSQLPKSRRAPLPMGTRRLTETRPAPRTSRLPERLSHLPSAAFAAVSQRSWSLGGRPGNALDLSTRTQGSVSRWAHPARQRHARAAPPVDNSDGMLNASIAQPCVQQPTRAASAPERSHRRPRVVVVGVYDMNFDYMPGRTGRRWRPVFP